MYDHRHDEAREPSKGLLRKGFEWTFNTTVELQRLAAVKEYIQNNSSIKKAFKVSDAELAAHRMIGMDEFVLSKTRVRFSRTLSLLQEWTGGGISNSDVLDIGASDGLLLKYLGCSGVGLDINSHWPLRMRAKGVVGIEGLAEQLPFIDQAFDYILCFECLEHVENPIALLREMQRVCRRAVFISIPWVAKTKIRADDYDAKRNVAADHHVFEFNDVDFRKIVSHTKFRVAHHHLLKIYNVPSFGVASVIRKRLQLDVPSWSLYCLELKK